MNIANLYRKIKQIVNDGNVALVNKGLNAVNNLYEIPGEISNIESINKLTYVLSGEIIEITANDLNGITTIDSYAFYGCNSLSSITIPNTVTSIGSRAFYSCDVLNDIYMPSTTPPTLGSSSSIPTIAIIHVPVGSGDAYKSATNWSSIASRIVEDIEI